MADEQAVGGEGSRTSVRLRRGRSEHGFEVDKAALREARDEGAAGLDEGGQVAAWEDDIHVQVLRLGLVDVGAPWRKRLVVVRLRGLERLVLHGRTGACGPATIYRILATASLS